MRKHLPTEQELISLLKAKEKKGFDLLYDNYAKALYCIIAKIVHDQEIAQDVLQDSFVKIWQHIADYDPAKGSLFTYILNIARNTAIDRTRSLAYKKDISASRLDAQCRTVDKLYYTELHTDMIDVRRCIPMLQVEHQQVINSIYIKGYTQLQAAEQLQIPLGTVKTRAKKAIACLRALLL